MIPSSALADARTEARRHFRAGMELITKRKFDEGIRELEKAHELLPHPNVVFNIARAHVEAGNLEQAIARYREYIASEPEDRDKAAQVLRQLEEKLNAQRAAAADASKPPPATPPPVPPPRPPTPPSGEQPPTGEQPPGGQQPPSGQQPPAGEQPKAPGPKPPEDAAKPAKPPASEGPDTTQIVGEARTEDIYQETVVTASRGAQ
ncbi:MAG TPA: tetratricopeptide repeat protein, partial [Candidatus Nanopelagicales bacterium]|nr:tetratricopeptide repeat protein [Candidatus Nanopelagicales bacterium]